MKRIISGSRGAMIDTPKLWWMLKHTKLDVTEIVSGGSGNVDICAERLAEFLHLPKRVFMADWQTHGKAAGPLRNTQMAEYGEAVLAVWNGNSPGTKHLIAEAKRCGLPIFIHKAEMSKGASRTTEKSGEGEQPELGGESENA